MGELEPLLALQNGEKATKDAVMTHMIMFRCKFCTVQIHSQTMENVGSRGNPS